MNPSSPAIHLSRISFLRGDRWILRNIDWTVPAGTCAAILGPNGSGKSTLARIIATHLWPTEGEVSVLGSVFGQSDLQELRKSIRLIQPAGPYDVVPELSALEVVLTGFFGTLGLYAIVTEKMKREAAEVLSRVGLARVADHAYATLSSGERVRALIARALVVRPGLLLLDEPTAGLDILAREQVLATVQALFEFGNPPPTVIFITHHVEELPPITSQALLLSDGQAAASGAPADVFQSAVLSQVYGCQVQVRNAGGRYYLEIHPDSWKDLLH